MKINLVMIMKNEERSLRKCLKSAKPIVDEIIIADTGSNDRSLEIAREMGAQVFEFSWVNDFSAARNFALSHSDGDWNLVLDGDEYVRDCSRQSLEAALRSREGKGTWLGGILRYDFYEDENGISQSTSILPRLLPKGITYTGPIHEQPEGNYPCYQIPLTADHDGYLNTNKGERNLPYLEQAVRDYPDDGYYHFQLASTLRNLKKPEASLPHFQRFYGLTGPKDPYRPGGIVLYLYTLLDIGTTSCLDEAARLIEAEASALGGWSDFCFVCGLFYMKRVLSDINRYITLLPRIEESYKTCLSLGEHPEAGGVVGTGSFKAAYNLGAWYEVSGHPQQALHYYAQSAKFGYQPAIDRLQALRKP